MSKTQDQLSAAEEEFAADARTSILEKRVFSKVPVLEAKPRESSTEDDELHCAPPRGIHLEAKPRPSPGIVRDRTPTVETAFHSDLELPSYHKQTRHRQHRRHHSLNESDHSSGAGTADADRLLDPAEARERASSSGASDSLTKESVSSWACDSPAPCSSTEFILPAGPSSALQRGLLAPPPPAAGTSADVAATLATSPQQPAGGWLVGLLSALPWVGSAQESDDEDSTRQQAPPSSIATSAAETAAACVQSSPGSDLPAIQSSGRVPIRSTPSSDLVSLADDVCEQLDKLTPTSDSVPASTTDSSTHAADQHPAQDVQGSMSSSMWKDWAYILSASEEWSTEYWEQVNREREEELQRLRERAHTSVLRPYLLRMAEKRVRALSREETELLLRPLDASKRSKIIEDAVDECASSWLDQLREAFFLRERGDLDAWERFRLAFHKSEYAKNTTGSMSSFGFQASAGPADIGLTARVLSDIMWTFWKVLSSAVSHALHVQLNVVQDSILVDLVRQTEKPIVQMWIATARHSAGAVARENIVLQRFAKEEAQERKKLDEIKQRGVDAKYSPPPPEERSTVRADRIRTKAHGERYEKMRKQLAEQLVFVTPTMGGRPYRSVRKPQQLGDAERVTTAKVWETKNLEYNMLKQLLESRLA
mmetsp:Transcript_6516/g.16454  ORF Transcript_6516/g.16454 Transcript_6516/m.16454 type:complete len:653 (+) Transcript_6516:296-2254(+)